MRYLALVLLTLLSPAPAAAGPAEDGKAERPELASIYATPAIAVFNKDETLLKKEILENLDRLQGIEKDAKTGRPPVENRKWHRAYERGSVWGKNAALMDSEDYIARWTPPPDPHCPDAEPRLSEIWITIGCLKTNHRACAVELSRRWVYNARNHIPYTNIPLWRSDFEESFDTYASDHEWLQQLTPVVQYGKKHHEPVNLYDMVIMQQLKALPSN